MSSWLRAAALAAMAFACLPGEARADGGAAQYRYVPACDGSYGPLNASGPSTLTYDLHGQLCTVGTAGGGGTAATPFAPAGVYSLLSVSAATSNVSLPAGSTVVVYNTGTTDAFVHLGSSAGVTATVNQDAVKAGQSVAFAVGTNTFLAAITASSTTTLTLSGGSGIFTGVGGGGSGGGGGGPVTQATIPWVSSITTWAGSTLGAITTYGTAPAGLVPGINAFVTNTINAAVTNAVGVTQSTSPWVTSVTSFVGWAGGTLGAMANYGTSPGPVLVPGVNAFVTNSLTVTANAGTNLNTSNLALDASVGTTNVALGSPGATVCATDTGSCSANALLQRIAARLSTLISGGVVTQGTTPWVDSVTTWAGSTLGAISNYGTAPGAVLVPAVNAFVTNAATIGISPAFQPGNAYAALSVTTTTANVALPAGTTAVVYNTGANDAFVHLGTSGAVTATASHDVLKAGQSVAYVVGANTFIAALTAAGTTTLTVSGGTGGFAGVGGGGSGGGGGGAVTQATIPWIDNITQWSGQALGAISNYGTSPGAVLVPSVNAFVTNTLTVTANAGTNLNTSALALDSSVGTTNTDIGAPGATACVSDTGTCSVNALLQRLAQRISTLIAGGVVTQGTTPWVVGATQWAGATLGAMSNYGTSPGSVLVPGVNAFITGSIGLSPAFQPGNAYATLSVTTASANVALPAGATVVVYNTGLNDAFVHFGTSAAVTATATQELVKVGQSVAYVVGANTFIAAITASSTTTLSISGGTGGFAAVGGGGGAGGGSAFSVVDSAAWTASTSPFVPSGGEFNAGATALSTGQQGTIALTANRHQLTLEDNSAAILAAMNAAIPVGSNIIGKVGIDPAANVVSASVTAALPTTPTATITLPSTTTAYTANQLIANNATAGSVVNPSFAIGNSAGAAIIARVRLSTNDATSTAWGAQTIQVDLWTTTPTWTNGDRGTWSPATQTGAHLGAYTCVMSAEYGDGAYAECAPTVGSYSLVKLASGTSVFWSLKAISGSGVTGASKVFTLTPEVQN